MEKRDSFIDYLKETPNFLTTFILPIYFMTVNPMLLEMSKSTGISSSSLAMIITFFTIGLTLGQLTSVFYNRRFSKMKIIFSGYIIIIAILIILSFNSSRVIFYTLYSLMGYCAGVISLQATKSILENEIKNKDRLITIFLSFYPIGNISAPFLASTLIRNNISWRYSYYVIAFMALIILILYIAVKRGWKGKLPDMDEKEKIPFSAIFHSKKINTIFIFGCILLFFYCISETIIAAWAPTFLRVEKLFDIRFASFSISVFWLATFTGRMIVSTFAGKVKTNYILLSFSIISIISMVVFTFAKSAGISLLSIALAGFGCSAIFSLGVSSTSTIYTEGRGVLATVVYSVCNIGVSVTPFLIKYVSGYSMILSLVLAPVFMGMTLLVIIYKIIYENKINPIG